MSATGLTRTESPFFRQGVKFLKKRPGCTVLRASKRGEWGGLRGQTKPGERESPH